MPWNAVKYLVFGALAWAVGAVLLARSQEFLARSEPAELIVLQVDSRLDAAADPPRRLYRPVFGLHTTVRPRPEYASNLWSRPALHQAGDIVPGRYDPESGEMQSDKMTRTTTWLSWFVQALGLATVLQGVLMLFGAPEALLPIRIRPSR